MHQKVNTLTLNSSDYPEILRTIHSPPKLLFYRGENPSNWLFKPKVSVVGSRKMTNYGKAVTQKIVSELARAGVVIVSGLAYGVDACAHRTALDAGGITAAVLGSAVERITPSGNHQLGMDILTSGGTIFSEYPLETNDYAGNFVVRNRIVSGLCDILLVTEAALKSGSLHTARFALEQGKTVMAVPGSIIGPSSEGCNNLIKSGAIPVTSAEDIFFALKINPDKIERRGTYRGPAEAQLVLQLIQGGITNQEDLAATARLDGQAVSGALTTLELAGEIRPTGGGHWAAS